MTNLTKLIVTAHSLDLRAAKTKSRILEVRMVTYLQKLK